MLHHFAVRRLFASHLSVAGTGIGVTVYQVVNIHVSPPFLFPRCGT